MLFSPLIVSLFAALTLAAPRPLNHVLHEKRSHNTLDAGWTKRDPVAAGTKFPVRIGMTQRNLHMGHDLLMEVSDPSSPKYGKHYTAEEVHELFAPHDNTVNALLEWLDSNGIEGVTQSYNKQWLQFDAEVQVLEELLQTKYHDFEHVETGAMHPACDQYHVPAHVQSHIDYITPGINMMTVKMSEADKAKRTAKTWHGKDEAIFKPIVKTTPPGSLKIEAATAGDLSICSNIITPACIMALYGITNGTKEIKNPNPSNQLGIFETEGQCYSQSDLNTYYKGLAPWIPKGTGAQIHSIDGGKLACDKILGDYEYYGIEAALDYQASIPIVYPQGVVGFEVDDYYWETYTEIPGNGFLNTFFDGIDGSYCHYSAFGETGDASFDPIYPDNKTGYYGGDNVAYDWSHPRQCGAWKPTNVVSISYGFAEAFLPTNYMQRQCSEILKLGLQGTTVVSASGDSGVSGRGYCLEQANGEEEAFAPSFPTNCPYVLAVGSTFLPVGKSTVGDPEIPTTLFGSGGGFSNVFGTADYQAKAVSKFLNSPKLNALNYTSYSQTGNSTNIGNGTYNRAGRGYPDVAAVGDNFLFIADGAEGIVGGTSLSSPVFASILTRINEERLAAGKATVGYVHPALYANPSMFTDIHTGSNNPASAGEGCGTTGFPATIGWDPVSGLGTPKYPEMLAYFMSLP